MNQPKQQPQLRPISQITDLIGKLDRWATKREAKKLDTRDIRAAIEQLAEYREWAMTIRNSNARHKA